MADFTYVWTAEGWLYVAVVLDLYSRRAVGWSMSSSMTAQLVIDALMMALWRRGKPTQLMHHSDQGSFRCIGAVTGGLAAYRPPNLTGEFTPERSGRTMEVCFLVGVGSLPPKSV